MASQLNGSHSKIIPALVLGSGITALGVARSLGRENIPVFYPCHGGDIASHSRWLRQISASLDDFSSPKQLTAFLKGLPFEKMVVFPCSDSWTRAVAGLNPEMAVHFPSSLTSLENIEMLSDKSRFAKVIRQNGLPHPRTILLETERDLEALSDELFEGAFLKPARSQEFFEHFKVKAFRTHSRIEALSRLREIQKAGFAAMLQEYIPGPATHHYFIDGFVDRFGRVCARFARQRLRMYPPDFGNSTYMISVALREISEAVATVDRLLSSIRFRGIFSTELKYDRRDGLFKILEVNARPWWFIEFATTSGVNVCRLAYEDALGMRVQPIEDYNVGSRCLHPYYDLHSFLHLYRGHQLTIGSWLKSWWGAKQPEFCWDDPLPAIWDFFSRIHP
jgi:D-aspartate ligase